MQLSKGRRNFLLVLISVMVGAIYYVPYIRFSFYDQTLAALQLTNIQLGTLGSVYGLVALFCYPIGGLLTQKFGPKILLTISFVGTGLCTLWQLAGPSYGVLLFIYVLFAIFTTATLWAPYVTFLRSLGTEEEQGRLFGISETMRGVISTLLGFAFVWVFGLFASELGGFRVILIICAILYAVFAILAFVCLPGTQKEAKKEEVSEAKSSYRVMDILKLPGVWLVGIFMFLCYTIIAAGTGYLGTYTTYLGVSAGLSSAMAIIRTYIITIFSGLVAGVIADKFKYRCTFLTILLISVAILSVLMLFIKSSIILSVVISMAIAAGYLMIKSTYFSIMGEGGIPREATGLASGVISFIAFIPDACIYTIIGAWLDKDLASGFNKMFYLIIACAVLAVVLSIMIKKRYVNSLSKAE